MKRFYFSVLIILSCIPVFGQPRYDMKRIQREKLGRGVVALRGEGQVFVSWRTLSSDKKGQTFDVYRNGVKINDAPLKSGGTFFTDHDPLDGDAVYEVRSGKQRASYTLKADSPEGYIPVKLDKPADGVTPDGRKYTYSANDASVGDVDGDGEYEIFLKWDPSNSRDNAHTGFTGSTYIDCYRISGERLWRIDLGRNIRSGAHYVPFVVYDFDGDGRAELMVKTSDGTVDGLGKVIGNQDADYREDAAVAAAWLKDHSDEIKLQEEQEARMRKEWEEMRKQGKRPARGQADRRGDRNRRMPAKRYGFQGTNKTGRILSGAEYITVFNGLTGAAMATENYIPQRGLPQSWGDGHGNRSERYLAGLGYFDGKRASAFFCRGYYTRTVIAAWDWDGKKLTNKWTFDTDSPQWKSYAGQGNHNLRVADVDGDGCDEITYGSMAVDHDGTGLYNTGMGHGDAMHLTVFDPKSDALQLWDCHENRRDGSELRNARTGEIIFQIKSGMDVGRCMAADIDPTNPGLEMWSSDSHGIRNIHGGKVLPKPETTNDDTDPTDNEDNTALFVRGKRVPTNFAVWWDDDLLRELLDHETVYKYDWTTGYVNEIMKFDGCKFNNGTKSNPCLSGDILGDWREEVVVRTEDSSELRIYVSPIPTDYRINCLMEDIPYRISIATENVGYNQPPETGFYLGPDESAVDFLR